MAKTPHSLTLLLAMLPVAIALSNENLPEARFRGPPTYDFGVTNVKWEAATPEYSYVTFDLHWSYSWRAKWTEPAKTSATGKDMELENWDAAWVFVKFLPERARPSHRGPMGIRLSGGHHHTTELRQKPDPMDTMSEHGRTGPLHGQPGSVRVVLVQEMGPTLFGRGWLLCAKPVGTV